MPGTKYTLIALPRVPPALSRLTEMANNLIYSWDRELRGLFRRLDNELYQACGNNPKVFLQRVSQAKLDTAASDQGFIEAYQRVLSGYDNYHAQAMPADLANLLDPQRDLIAYFCFEYGFHESVPLYSGGLGILAADHCKAASDLALPFVAVGVLYRQGYFVQTIDGDGRQIAHYHPTSFDSLPFTPVLINGHELIVSVPLLNTEVRLKVWSGQAGHSRILLLDSDLAENSEELRTITHNLYGGDSATRIRQEIVLGIGGVRALRALGLAPTVWHINEGHPAFLIVERCIELVRNGWSLDEALELVACATVFTTHTPVAAGHDVFNEDLLWDHLGSYIERSGIGREALLALGGNHRQHGFNMTTLGLTGSRHHNGVSQVHGKVAAQNERGVWHEIPPAENPLQHVTNGVHLKTFLALEWVNLFDVRFGDWRSQAANPDFWKCIDEVPDHRFSSLRQELKAQLFADLRRRLTDQFKRNDMGDATLARATALMQESDRDVLVIGFARRFATYKRAGLLFSDIERLAKLMADPARPVLLIVAGKAHPHDQPGKDLLNAIHKIAMSPAFIGHVVLLENYDLALARTLVAGVDVWLNTPEYPLEASGTSGMKAGMNGAVNLSVLDGWWAEGFDGTNGFGVVPHPGRDNERDREEAQDLIEILERKVIPLYFDRDHRHISPGWIDLAKASMRTIIPRFNSVRMLRDYITKMYAPARDQFLRLSANDGVEARQLAAWRQHIAAHWHGVGMRRIDTPQNNVAQDESMTIEVAVNLNGLSPDDVRVECVVTGSTDDDGDIAVRVPFSATDAWGEGETLYRLILEPPNPGVQFYRLRMYPTHPLLTHPFELGRMRWI